MRFVGEPLLNILSVIIQDLLCLLVSSKSDCLREGFETILHLLELLRWDLKFTSS